MSTLVERLQQKVENVGDVACFIFRDQHHGRYELSWRSLYRLGGRFAAVLKRGGLGRGDLVLNTLLNSPERVVCEAGIWLSGSGSVNGQRQLADGSDLLRTIRVSRVSTILLDPDVPNSPWELLKDLLTLGNHGDVTSSTLTDLKKVFFIRREQGKGEEDFLTQLEAESDWFQADVLPDDIMTVFATSGTTGFNKLVAYTHGDFIKGGDEFSSGGIDKYQVVVLNMAPLGWLGGYPGLSILFGGVRVLFDQRSGNPSNMVEFIWRCLQEEKCNSASLIPTLLPDLARLAQNQPEICSSDPHMAPVGKLFHMSLAGLPITHEMVKDALILSHSVTIYYAATDFFLGAKLTVTDSGNYVDHDVGQPLEGVSVKIVRADDESQVMGVNQLGNILLKRRKVNQGFLNDPQATAEAFTEDGFYRTGDTGRVDERGHLIVEGRSHDAIMRGAYIFYPAWLESRIRECPGVADVLVVGVPDPKVKEELCACVVLKSEEVMMEEVRQFVERDVVTPEDDPMSPRPRYYLQFQSFPHTITNKPKRNVVKKEAAERLNLSPQQR